MKNHSPEQTAATAKTVDAMLAVSTIYFNSIGELSELALTSARETADECLSASKAAFEVTSPQEAVALRSRLGQSVLARIVAQSTECVQIVSRSQRETARALAAQFATPFMPVDVKAAMAIFSSGLSQLATTNAGNLAAATKAAAEMSAKISAQPKKAA